MKILFIAPQPPPIGGIASWLQNILIFLKENNRNMSFYLCDSAIKGRKITSKSFLIRIYTGIYKSFKIYFDVKKNIRKNKPDIIHLTSSASFALFKDYLIIQFAKNKKIPIVLHWHFGRIPEIILNQNWEWKLLRSVITKSNVSIVIDKKSYDALINEGFDNVVNIPNPIALAVEQRALDIQKQSNLKQSNRLIFVGHVIEYKGVYELVKACLLTPQVTDLLIVGPYDKKVVDELSILAKERDNGRWLKITGALDKEQVLELMNKSLILSLPSYTEGFPNVIIEAMAMGCAIVATDVGAIPEMIEDKSNVPCGICVPVQNIPKLKIAIEGLLENPSKAKTMGNQGINKVLNSYTLDKIVDQYVKVWKQASLQTN